MNVKKLVTAMLVATMVVAAGAPAIAAADNADEPDGVDVDATQSADTGNVTVTVAENGTAVANATVEVNASGNYTGEGTYTTDANGTVELAAPDERVTVNVTATAGGDAGSETFELVPLSESLAVDVTKDGDGSATATVTQYGSPVENATVEVNASGNYTGEGTYTTDANGTVPLDEPAEAVTVSVTATTGSLSAETSAELAPTDIQVRVDQNNDSVTATVTRNGTGVEGAAVVVESDDNYTDVGTYTTDANGTVDLSAPDKPVVVTVTATAGGDEATTTVTLERPGDPKANDFAHQLRAFIERLRQNGVAGFGQEISEFARKHNPSAADDRGADGDAKRGESANGENAAEDGSNRGRPDDAGDRGRSADQKGNGASDDRGGQSNDDRGSASDDGRGNDGGNGDGKARGRGN